MLKLVYAPDPILKKECSPVPQVDDHHRELISKMYDVMYEANGVGLAAPQVGIDMRIFILDPGAKKEEKKPLAMINPVLLSIDENMTPYEEGCLSFPEHFAEIDRPDKLKIEYLDENNKKKVISTDGFISRIIQHELDHLNGILFVDHLSRLKRDVIIRKMKKFKKDQSSI
jgi:peptide deformylase